MKRMRPWASGVAFVLVCGALLLFLRGFTVERQPYQFILWESATAAKADGAAYPLELGDAALTPEVGATYTFSGKLGDAPKDGYLFFEISGAEISISLDGEEIYRSVSVPPYEMPVTENNQAGVSLPADAAGKPVTMTVKPLENGQLRIFPPLLRVTSLWLREAETMAYSNFYALPAGALALALALLCGLFLLGLANRRADWSLLLMIFALGALTFGQIAQGSGYYFLPEALNQSLQHPWLRFAPSVAMLGYLLWNRRRDFWREFGIVSSVAVGVLLCLYFISHIRQGHLASSVNELLVGLFRYGQWESPVYWLTVYLVGACGLIAANGLVKAIIKMQTDTKTLTLKNELAVENCRALEQNALRMSQLRHDLKSQIAALHVMYQRGEMESLGQRLAEMDAVQSSLLPARFTEHFLINVILQNAAARAAQNDIRFEVNAAVPEALGIADADLSGFFLNLLDNAIEAAGQVEPPDKRFILFSAGIKNGFLALVCENSYSGTLLLDENGELRTAKHDADAHGFGLRQMRAVAEKYHSTLRVSYTDAVFTVRTALKPKE